MSEPNTIIFAGGGTGGHLFPGVSVADVLRKRRPDLKCVFLCTNRPIDQAILSPTPYAMVPQPIIPPVRTISGLFKFWESWRQTRELVKQVFHEHSVAAVVGLGGYAAGVAVKYAGQKKLPAAILNPDVVPGKANQFLMKSARAVCCQFEATRSHVPPQHQDKIRVTGCPIRAEISNLPPRVEAARRLGLDPLMHTLVVTGASQGAATVNEAILTVLQTLKLQGWQILHLAGRDHGTRVRDGYRSLPVSAKVVDFTPDMADIWAVADLAVSRAGAGSCAELTACGVPSILMPYPFHKDLHQRANAQILQEAGCAILMEDTRDRKTNSAAIKPLLESLLYDADKRTAMSSAARQLGHPDAAERVADVILEWLH